MGVSVQNLDAFDTTVQQWFKSVQKAAEDAALGLAKMAFKHVLEISPQFSGDFVANWVVGYNALNYSFTPQAVAPDKFWNDPDWVAHSRGDPEAQEYAKSHAHWQSIKLGGSIFLCNSAHHHGDNYAMKIEGGMIKFRDVNAGADAVVRKTALNLAGDISKAKLNLLIGAQV